MLLKNVLCIKSLYDFKEGNIGIKFVENFKKKLIKYQPSIKELVSKSINYIKTLTYF